MVLSVAGWIGDPGHWPLKLAPFLVPPFRALLLNGNGDFFHGAPLAVVRHHWDRLWGVLCGSVYGAFRGSIHRCIGATGKALWPPFLWLAARVLPRRHWHARMFHRLHGDDRLHPHLPPPANADVAVFPYAGTAWDGNRLEWFARSSSARWILWQADGHAGIEPPFDESDTFAFSLQEHFRAWKPVLVPAAPFRALQAGEASRVAAPLGRAILVDREKLLALGVPRCNLAASAWLMLFWKAAAAGFRSYSVGTGQALSEQPDFPVQETEFFLRTVSRPELRRLGPREPALDRGAVSFSARHRNSRAHSADRLRVLLVSPFLPYPLSHGGAVRIFNLCRALAPNVDFCLVALREHGETVDYDRLHEVFQEVYAVDIDERPDPDPSLPSQVRGHRSAALRALIARLAITWHPDLLQIEYTHMAAFRDAAPGIPAILVEHDLTYSLYRQLADSGRTGSAEAEFRRWYEFERRWLEVYDGVWTVSAEDRRAAIREGRRNAWLTFEVPNGVDTGRFVPAGESRDEVLYVGSFRHLPNIIGFERLRREVMPRIWKEHPGVRLRVVAGPRHEEFWNRFTAEPLPGLDPRIEISGFVEDLRPHYARAAVVAVPLEVSAGTNIKVLEAMSCGKPVVTTAIGCAGLDLEPGRDVVVASGWEDFAAAVCRLLNDSEFRGWLGAHARRTAEDRFSWNVMADSALQSYRALYEHRFRLPAAGD